MGVVPCAVNGQAGVNVAVYARHATAVDVCLYDEAGVKETARVRLPACTGGVWHGFIPGPAGGQRYGLRAHGPWDPASGHRFNPARLLIDPWARSLSGPLSALARETGHQGGAPDQRDTQDNAGRVPKARIVDLAAELRAGAAIAVGPQTPMARTILYEAHVKALTALHPEVPPSQRGTYAGLASPAMLRHYRNLGITSLCLLPVHLHVDELHLVERGLTNHWGYNSLAFFVPDPRYATVSAQGAGNDDAGVRAEFRQMVDALHRHGIEVILDVVYNHTAEGDAFGPTLSWRGLDNSSWYALDAHAQHLNPSGCGNTLNMGEERVVQLVMDSLRWWVQAYGVDGFRFDLAVALGRDPALAHRFNAHGALFAALAQDPVLAGVKLIAEPWDIGPDGYQAGRFGPRWQEWNDQFRDTARAWWLGHACTRGQIARRLAGSNDLFESSGRGPLTSINFITAHDGFTLADLTSYQHKHNQANGEDNRDGHGHNLSANAGHEGPSAEPAIQTRREQWRRALLATLFCAQGTPQLLAGDELGHSQQGNNNAYCQDNPITWLDWNAADAQLTAFVAGLARLRQRHAGLRHPTWFHGKLLGGHQQPDVEWRTAEGAPPDVAAWERPDGRLLTYVITVGESGQPPGERLMLILLAGEQPVDVRLPDGEWGLVLDSARGWVAGDTKATKLASSLLVEPPTMLILVQPLQTSPEATP
jgi:glycogen operon protein